MFATALYPQLGLAFLFLVNIDCLVLPSYIVLTGLDVSLIRMYSSHGQQGKQVHPSAYARSISTPRYRGYQLWKVHETDLQKTTHFLTKYGAELWNINQDGIDVLITKTKAKAAKNYIDSTNFTFNVMISDVEAAIDETYLVVNDTKLTNTPWLEREGTLMDWNRYHDLGDITDFLNYCLETYPDIVEKITIGRTYNKRNIEVLRISNGNRKNRAVFVSSGLQGRDWISPAAITFAISKLLWLWDHSSNFQSIDWYFLPVANPDGFQYSWLTDRLWTKNRRHFGKCYGTHIDRNFGYNWGGGGGSDNECKNFYRGPKPFSEQETKAIRQFLRNISPKLDAFITIGAYGQVITYPWGDADYVTKNHNDLHKVAKRARLNVRMLNAAEYMIGSSYRLKLAQSGNIADWVQHDVSPKYVYSVCLKDQGRYGYLLPPDYIVESGEEAYEIIKTISSGAAKEERIYGRHANYI